LVLRKSLTIRKTQNHLLILFSLGQLLSNSVVAGFGQRTDRWAYRAPFAFQLAFVAILVVGWPFAPESPVYLVKKGRTADAEKVLQQIWGNKIDVVAKMTALRETIAEETAGKEEISLMACFRGTNLKRTIISMGVFVCQHAVGIIFVLGFSSCKS
jgi:MFS family permease